MAHVLDVSMLWTVVTDIFRTYNDRNNNAIDALGSVRKAFNHTYDYLRNKNGQYVSNLELSDLWNEASTAVMRVDKSLGNMLGSKSRFWAHPDIYIELNNAENILLLNQIIDEMERLQMRIR
jgi:hypothetical protein